MSKQYLLLCGDDAKVALEGVIQGIEFLEVQGLGLNQDNKFNLLLTPVLAPLNPAFIPPVMPAPPAPETPVADAPAPEPVPAA